MDTRTAERGGATPDGPGTMAGPAGRLWVDDAGDAGDGGDGDAVVLLHSLAGASSQWAAQLSHLRVHRRAVAFDARGHGRSDRAENDAYGPEAMADDLSAVVDTLACTRFVLVGHSYGAAAAIVYAARCPHRVAGLLLVDPIGDMRRLPAADHDDMLTALRSTAYRETIDAYWQSILDHAKPWVRDAVVASLWATAPAAVIGAFDAMRTFDPVTPFEAYPGPRFSVITPLNDTPVSLHRVVRDLPTIELGGTSHWLQMDAPERFNPILDDFLARCRV